MTLAATALAALSLVSLLTGCGALVHEPGYTTACLSAPAGVVLASDSDETTFDVDGTLTAVDIDGGAFEDSFGCWETPELGFTVEDADGCQWTVGYGVTDGNGDLVAPMIQAVPGDEVHLTYRHIESWGRASGFVLEDEEGLVAAVEQGTWGPALRNEDLPGLTVSVGDEVYRTREECGTFAHHEIVFDGIEEEAVPLVPFAHADVADTHPYGLYAASSTDLVDAQCTDVGGVWMWAAFRTYWQD